MLLNSFWATHIGDASNAPAWWVFGAIVVVLVLVLNYLGVRLAIRAMLAFAAVVVHPDGHPGIRDHLQGRRTTATR